jgi:hypothetical protein
MGMIRGTGFGFGLVLALAGAGMLPAAAEAQVVVGERMQCQCVDADGNRIENCTCIRSGEVPLRSFTLSALGLDRRAQIGVYIDMTQDDENVDGVRITEVMEDSPADDAGLMEGDVVVSVDGRSVFDALDDEEEDALDDEMSLLTQRFVAIVGDLDPDEEVEVVVLRDGAQRMLRVTPEAAQNVFRFDGLDEMDFDFRGLGLDEEAMRGLRESIEGAREGLRSYNFRFDDEERAELERRLERDAERLQRDAERMRELADRNEVIFERRGWDAEEGRAGSGGFFFSRPGSDPCVQLHTEDSGDVRVMVFGGNGCVDGLQLADMNEGLAAYFGTADGVLVTEVAESATLGLEAGDVILSIGDREVAETQDVRRILASFDIDEPVTFRVRRDNREIQVSGTRRAN